jgi:hypothetical protein
MFFEPSLRWARLLEGVMEFETERLLSVDPSVDVAVDPFAERPKDLYFSKDH